MLRYLVTCHAWQTWHRPGDIRWGNPEHANCFNCDKLRRPGLLLTLPSQCDSHRDIWWWLWWYYQSYQSVSVSNLLQIFTSSCVHRGGGRARDSCVLRLHVGQNNGKYKSSWSQQIIVLIVINEWGHCARYNSPHSGQQFSCFPCSAPLLFPSLWAALTPRLCCNCCDPEHF